MPIIKVENLSKKYILSHQRQEPYTALRDVITNKFKAAGRKMLHPFTLHPSPFTDCKEDFWALKDVSFEIEQGDRVGIIGRNGAGKSTLLKILSRITEPTGGKIGINGRVASLLEVGTGFHPELTGRENIYLNGAILGMTRIEIKQKFDEIVAFAEVEKFLDTPVKHFSSGMYVRLAFAVAAHLEPEILIVDEVLAVGDAQFQKKCLGKMEEVSNSDGRTILFVSHNLTAIQNLCSKALYLERGLLIDIGQSHQVIEHYLKYCVGFTSLIWQGHHPENEFLTIEQIKILTTQSEVDDLYLNDEIHMQINLKILKHVTDIAFELFINTIQGIAVFSSITDTMSINKGKTIVFCLIPKNIMNNGHYTITVGISKNYSYFIAKINDALTINMLNSPEGIGWQGEWPGVVRPKIEWKVINDHGQDNL